MNFFFKPQKNVGTETKEIPFSHLFSTANSFWKKKNPEFEVTAIGIVFSEFLPNKLHMKTE